MNDLADLNIENTAPLPKPPEGASNPGGGHGATACKNCGATLTGDYCHACGQSAHVHRSLLHVVEEVIHGITHFDSRAWRSLPMLVFRPGTLTRNYVLGQRARYLPPFAMFLFSVFAMFLGFAFSGGPGIVGEQAAPRAQSVHEAQMDLRQADTEVAAAQRELANAQAAAQASPDDPGLAGRLAGAQGALTGALAEQRAARDAARQSVVDKAPGTGGASLTVTIEDAAQNEADRAKALAEIKAEKARAAKEGNQAEVAALSVAETAIKAGSETAKQDGEGKAGDPPLLTMLKDSMARGEFFVTPWPDLNDKIKKKTANPDLFLYKLQNTAYKFSFLLIPISLPFLWLMLFWKRGVTLYDHAVFALYSIAFMSFLFLVVATSARWLSWGTVSWALLVVPPVHLFFHFKGSYALGWFSALWRTSLFTLVFAWLAMTAFVLAIMALGVAG